MIITFIGHSSLKISDKLLDLIKEAILNNIDKYEENTFYCGGYGDFDEICRKVSCDLKKDFENIEVVFVSPYFTVQQQRKFGDLIKNRVYDSVVYPELEKVPLKFAINYRNQWMIEKSDLIIAYVDKEYGGAHTSLCFAQKKKKKIINLAEKCWFSSNADVND